MHSRESTVTLRVLTTVLRPLLMALTRRHWLGTERFPDGGFVLAVNHISYADPLLVAHVLHDNGIPPRFLAKAAVLDVPVVGRILRATSQIPVRRGSAEAAAAFTAAVDAVERGACVVFYPDGTLTRDPGLWPMTGRTGAVRVALATGCPLVPMAQWGAQDILYPYSKRVRLLPRRTCSVLVGAPIDLDDLRGCPLDSAVLQAGTERLVDALTAQLAQLRQESAPAERHDPRRAAGDATDSGASGEPA